MKSHYQVAVIGAGPAGMTAATTAANLGAEVLVIDEQSNSGGQIYRQRKATAEPTDDVLGQDYLAGDAIKAEFANAPLDYIATGAVWEVSSDRVISIVGQGGCKSISADKIIICTGAQERPMPFPGWTLPGVLTAGAGQVLLKSANLIPNEEVVLAGSGPLLLLLANQYLRAGVTIKALVDTTPKKNMWNAIRNFGGALRSPGALWKGGGMIAGLNKAGVTWYRNATNLQASGEQVLEQLHFNCGSQSHTLKTENMLIHNGVVPQLHLAMAADCAIGWNAQQQCWQGLTDEFGRSSVAGIYLAGDTRAIVGAEASVEQGRVAALCAAMEVGATDSVNTAMSLKQSMKRLRKLVAIRPFLDELYSPAAEFMTPTDETIVCRCEEISAKEIRQVAQLGCQGPNQAKSFCRAGMGPCQGRQCSNTVSALIAEEQDRSIEDVGTYRVRSPVKPVTLGQKGRS